MPKSQKHTDQSRRFIETARQLECDENEAAFEEKLRRIATAKPKSSQKPKVRGQFLKKLCLFAAFLASASPAFIDRWW
jgi:hypothetical protein